MAATYRSYTPYGDVRGSSPASWPGQRAWLGVGTTDTNTGLTNVGAREYEPSTGRFISRDPVFSADDAQNIGGYTYSGNDPLNKMDPSGLFWGSSVFKKVVKVAAVVAVAAVVVVAVAQPELIPVIAGAFAEGAAGAAASGAGLSGMAMAGAVAAGGTAVAEGGAALGLSASAVLTGRMASAAARGTADDPPNLRGPRRVPDLGLTDPVQMWNARAQRDSAIDPAPGSDVPAPGSRARKPWAGAYDSEDLSRPAIAARSGSGDCCEGNAAKKLGIEDIDAHYTPAWGWDGDQLVKFPVCTTCQGETFPHQYAPGTTYAPGGAWDNYFPTSPGPIAPTPNPFFGGSHHRVFLDD